MILRRRAVTSCLLVGLPLAHVVEGALPRGRSRALGTVLPPRMAREWTGRRWAASMPRYPMARPVLRSWTGPSSPFPMPRSPMSHPAWWPWMPARMALRIARFSTVLSRSRTPPAISCLPWSARPAPSYAPRPACARPATRTTAASAVMCAMARRCATSRRASAVKYTCCKPEPATAPAPSSCDTRVEGGPTSCKSVETWKLYAHQACQDAGLQLADYGPSEDCGEGNFRTVKYTCCKPQRGALGPNGEKEALDATQSPDKPKM